MKTLIFVAMVVGSIGFAETSPQAGTHGQGGKAPQTSVQTQAPKVDPSARLNQLVNACLVSQGTSKNPSTSARTR